MSETEIALFKRAIKVWGAMPQLFQALEELSELQIEIHKIRRNRVEDLTDLAGEVADVQIMLDQIHTMYGSGFSEVVDIIRERKITRLDERVTIAEEIQSGERSKAHD